MYFTRAMFRPEIVNKRQHTFKQLASICVIMCSRFVQVSVAVVKHNDDPQSYFCQGSIKGTFQEKPHKHLKQHERYPFRYPSKESNPFLKISLEAINSVSYTENRTTFASLHIRYTTPVVPLHR